MIANRLINNNNALQICIKHGLFLLVYLDLALTSDEAEILFKHLLGNNYNKFVRPVGNVTSQVVVKIGLRLSQIIEVDERSQIMTTNAVLEHQWRDPKLSWSPDQFGNLTKLYVPSEQIWIPDIVLYNSADGNFTVRLMTKATLYHTGIIEWRPPVLYKSSCEIDISMFPFDMQTCFLKVSSWSYDGYNVDIQHINLDEKTPVALSTVEMGINLADYQSSASWYLMGVPAKKYEKYYTCCSIPYPDLKFYIKIKRKTLFYLFNLILPCVAICSLTPFVFFTPSHTGEKITMGFGILNSLNIFLLVVFEISPPTSLAVPLIGKFLLFTMVLITCSIVFSVFVLNMHFRRPSTSEMPKWTKSFFLEFLPRLLLMKRPPNKSPYRFIRKGKEPLDYRDLCEMCRSNTDTSVEEQSSVLTESTVVWAMASAVSNSGDNNRNSGNRFPPSVTGALLGVASIAEQLQEQEKIDQITHDWQFVARVVDRLLFWIFLTACIVGTFTIIAEAPLLHDDRTPLG